MKKKLFVLCLSLVMVLSLAPTAIFADEAASNNVATEKVKRALPGSPLKPIGKALTPPPPTEFQPFSLIDPEFKYLYQAQVYIDVQSDNKLSISAVGFASQEVDQMNIQLTLERYTGTKWVTQYSSITYKAQDVSIYSATVNDLAPLSGYYYRTKAFIYARDGVFSESVTKYSHYTLAP